MRVWKCYGLSAPHGLVIYLSLAAGGGSDLEASIATGLGPRWTVSLLSARSPLGTHHVFPPVLLGLIPLASVQLFAGISLDASRSWQGDNSYHTKRLSDKPSAVPASSTALCVVSSLTCCALSLARAASYRRTVVWVIEWLACSERVCAPRLAPARYISRFFSSVLP